MPRAFLTPAQRERVRKAMGYCTIEDAAAAFGISASHVKSIWQGRDKPARVVTDEVRELVVAGKAEGKTNAELMRLSGFSECTVRMILADAREEGDMRAHPDPAVRAEALRQRAAAGAAHREGAGISPVAHGALPPNSMERSLIMRGMRPEMARLTANAWRDRHARQNAGRGG